MKLNGISDISYFDTVMIPTYRWTFTQQKPLHRILLFRKTFYGSPDAVFKIDIKSRQLFALQCWVIFHRFITMW